MIDGMVQAGDVSDYGLNNIAGIKLVTFLSGSLNLCILRPDSDHSLGNIDAVGIGVVT